MIIVVFRSHYRCFMNYRDYPLVVQLAWPLLFQKMLLSTLCLWVVRIITNVSGAPTHAENEGGQIR